MPRRSFVRCHITDEGIDGGKRTMAVQLKMPSADLLLADSLSEAGAYPTLAAFIKSELTPLLKRYVQGAREFVQRATLEKQNGTKQEAQTE